MCSSEGTYCISVNHLSSPRCIQRRCETGEIDVTPHGITAFSNRLVVVGVSCSRTDSNTCVVYNIMLLWCCCNSCHGYIVMDRVSEVSHCVQLICS